MPKTPQNVSADLTAGKQRIIGRPFLPGQSGNPNGRPVGSVSIVAEIKKELMKVADLPSNVDKKIWLDLFVSRIFHKSIADGDVSMIRDVISRVDGLPRQPIDVSDSDMPVEFKYLSSEEKSAVIRGILDVVAKGDSDPTDQGVARTGSDKV